MSDTKPKPNNPPAPTPSRPAPPPYSPNKALIGYIEKGQNQPVETRKAD
jgi:hypothetical protein